MNRSRIVVACLLTFLISTPLYLAFLFSASPSQARTAPDQSAGSPGHVSNPAGSLNAGTSGQGSALTASSSLGKAGHSVASAPGQPPSFARTSSPQVEGDQYWEGRFSGVDGPVYSVVVTGTSVYFGGDFTHIDGMSANHIAVYDTATGTMSPLTYGGINGTSGVVRALAVAGSNIYLGGLFSQAGGVTVNNVARWDGSQFFALGIGGSAGVFPTTRGVQALTVSPSKSELAVGGQFYYAGGQTANNIALYAIGTNSWSSVGTGYANGTNSDVRAIAYDFGTGLTDHGLYVGGEFTQAGGAPSPYFGYWGRAGNVWQNPSTDALNGSVYALSTRRVCTGTIGVDYYCWTLVYLGGHFTTAGTLTVNHLAQFDSDAGGYSALGVGTDDDVYAIADQAVSSRTLTPTLYIGGAFMNAGALSAHHVAYYNGASGWTAVPGLDGNVRGLAGSASNPLFAVGDFGPTTPRLARYAGGTWTPLGGPLDNSVEAVAISGNAAYVGGSFSQVRGLGAASAYLAKYDLSTGQWSTLGSGVNGPVRAMVAIGNYVFVGGDFTQAGGASANHVAAVSISNNVWSPLGSTGNNGVNATVRALASDGFYVYAGGDFTQVAGLPAGYIARYNISTAQWSSLGVGANNSVNALSSYGSDVFAGGAFTSMNGISANHVVRWSNAGSSWTALTDGGTNQNGTNGIVRALAVMSGNGDRLFAGGSFDYAGGQSAGNIAEYRITDGHWYPLIRGGGANGVSSVVSALAVVEGDVFAGGISPMGNDNSSQPMNYIGRWNVPNSRWYALGSGTDSRASALASSYNGSYYYLWVGGAFTYVGAGVLSPSLALYHIAPIPVLTPTPTLTPIPTTTNTATNTSTPSRTSTPTSTATRTATSTATGTGTGTSTATPVTTATGTSTPASTATLTSTATQTATQLPTNADAFGHLQPASPITVSMGTTFTLDLMMYSGSNSVVGQQSYLTFTNSLLQVVNPNTGGCVPASTVQADLSTFEASLQNSVDNINGLIAYSSGTFGAGVPPNTDFRVARVTFCASSPGDAVIHWQFQQPGRFSKINDPNSQSVSNPALYQDHLVHVQEGVLVGHVAWQGRPPQPDPGQQLPITGSLTLSGTSNTYTFPNMVTDSSGFFTMTIGALPQGTYTWWAKGPQYLASSGTLTLSGTPVTNQEMGLMKAGDVNNDNVVDITDFTLLRATFGRTCGDSGYDGRADLNGDCTVDITDFTLLRGNFGLSGDLPLQSRQASPGSSGPSQSPATPSATAGPPNPPTGGAAYLELRPAAGGPRSGGSIRVGDRLVLDLWVNGNGQRDLAGQQSYIAFTNSLLQNGTSIAPRSACVPSAAVTAETAVFGAVLQNEVCNGPGDCLFRGLKAPAGSIAFASGAAPGNASLGSGSFRVGQINMCATAPGRATLHWQLAPSAPSNRTSSVIDVRSRIVSSPRLFADYAVTVVGLGK